MQKSKSFTFSEAKKCGKSPVPLIPSYQPCIQQKSVVGPSKIQEAVTSREISSQFFDCTFHVNPGVTCRQMLAATQEQVQGMPFRSIIFMGIMNELAVGPHSQPSDEVNFQNATVTRDNAGRFRPRKDLAVRHVVGPSRKPYRKLETQSITDDANLPNLATLSSWERRALQSSPTWRYDQSSIQPSILLV